MFDDDEREHMPLEAREIHQQLLDDSSQWARTLPSDARVAEFARTLPRRMPSPSASPTRNVLTHRRPSSTLPDMMSVKGHTSMLQLQGARRTFAASIAAVAVVALIAGVLYTMHSVQDTHAGSGGGPNNSTVVVPTPEKTPPPTPGPFYQTPGPLARYVSEALTAGSRSADGTPIDAGKTYFQAGDWVYVTAMVYGLPKGSHVVSVAWYLNGIKVELPASAQTSTTIDGDKRVVFGLLYPTPGVGMAKLYIDRPAGDTSESPNDPSLAYTVKFIVAESERPTPTPFIATPTPHP